MGKFTVYCDPIGMEELCNLSPYNLKKDLKSIKNEELDQILEDVANELYQGVDRPPASSMIYWHNQRKAGYAKIRTVDVRCDDGKSNGYRCITLVDIINHRAFVLHIYKHGKGKDDNISNAAKNQLRKLVDEYVNSL